MRAARMARVDAFGEFVEAEPERLCDYDHRCGHCADCESADEDDDAPTAAELREHDRLEFQRTVGWREP